MEEKNDISILNLIEKNIDKIKASHNFEAKSCYISTIEKLCEAYDQQISAELINFQEEKPSVEKSMTKEQYDDFFKNAGILPNQPKER
ncbi:hypothetical protein [Lactobacillus gasseri]|jgi:hypothetical protein|uniref:hypothetical protein n=1 Tax=Lactobacillus gasseri TaxID=1596 RepID=UPI00205A4B2D|nr:hypothetical protein [Lactobacillus gasseri]MCZ9726858.1 hypothetical protein [Lactobacillus gasseri]MDX5065803.1 hypothetical protein [Lactobacillus gasseri]MDX5082504.1 hypothetical protein [Lactobacillus gasseri]DAV22954.1 MAG TPA: hypothetical protein [Caudoviricetes sp.]